MRLLTAIELGIGAGLAFLVSVYVFPAFVRYGQWQSQALVKKNLKELNQAETQYKNRFGTYTSNLHVIGWLPKGDSNYQYGFTKEVSPQRVNQSYEVGDDTIYTQIGPTHRAFLNSHIVGHGVIVQNKRGVRYVAAAVGNLDDDEALDRWVVNEKGQLNHLCDDLEVVWDDDPKCKHLILRK